MLNVPFVHFWVLYSTIVQVCACVGMPFKMNDNTYDQHIVMCCTKHAILHSQLQHTICELTLRKWTKYKSNDINTTRKVEKTLLYRQDRYKQRNIKLASPFFLLIAAKFVYPEAKSHSSYNDPKNYALRELKMKKLNFKYQ